jgi:hypothetical protein
MSRIKDYLEAQQENCPYNLNNEDEDIWYNQDDS